MTIVLDRIFKRFGEQVVVNNVSLSAEESELCVLLGSSGSGKSTILRIIAGLERPDEGSVQLRDVDVTHLPPQKRGMGFVFQNYALFKHLTVSQNVEFGLKIRGIARADRSARRDELLELVGLSGLGDRYPGQLSGGQGQRVALARALAYRPSVLLLDEPFGALDVKIRARLRRSLKALQRQVGITTILVTHDQEEAFELADRIAVVERGRIVEVGTPHGLYYQPQTEFTANFVGGGNVLFGRCKAGYVKLGAALLPLPPEGPAHSEGAPVRVLSRPEWVQYASDEVALSGGVPILGRGRVLDRLFAGAAEKIRFELDDLTGSQSIGLSYEYGQRGTLLDSLVSTAASEALPAVGEQRAVALKRYHILQPSSLRILTVASELPGGQSALETAAALAAASYGALSLLGIAASPEVVDSIEKRVLAQAQSVADDRRELKVASRIRVGTSIREVVLEAQEGCFDMLVLPSVARPGEERRISDAACHVLVSARVPVLLVSDMRSTLKRVLICTAGGEPGMADVRFAARISRHTGAVARVFHVQARDASDLERSRAQRHLQRACSVLTSFGVQSDYVVADGAPIQEIARELEAGGWDLLVVGAPGHSLFLDRDPDSFDARLLAVTELPILIVPTQE
jgi:sulfate transport system ATP-binding protein